VFADVRASPTTEEVYLYSLAQRSSEKHKQKPNETTKHIHKIHSQIYNSDEHLSNILDNDNKHLRLLHMMNVRFGLLNMAQRILGVTLPNF
jgi:trimethylamine:corrinoid methyltransferase-like protein